MRIDVFFDVYPHPAKPYFEAQLSEWQHQGQVLRLFSLGQIPGAKSQFDITHIGTLRQRPVQLCCKVALRILTHPARCMRIWRSERRVVDKVKRLVTDAQLPADAPDVYFMHNLATAVHFSYLAHAAPHTRLAIYYHGGEIPGVKQIPFEAASRALGRAQVIFSNTEASVAEAISRGAPPARTARVPVGFPLERFVLPADRTYLPDNRWRFVCVGRMAPEKGFGVALRAFAALRAHIPSFEATFIGGGPELLRLKQLSSELNLDDVVRFRGHVEFDALVPLLARFDALVLSSVPVTGSNWTETQATVMQEAMLMRTVVVAADIGGVRESLPPALHAYLYTPGSVPELRDRLIALAACDRQRLRELSAIAHEFVLTHYDIRAINEKLLHRLGSVAA